jgi:hypothetical protein
LQTAELSSGNTPFQIGERLSPPRSDSSGFGGRHNRSNASIFACSSSQTLCTIPREHVSRPSVSLNNSLCWVDNFTSLFHQASPPSARPHSFVRDSCYIFGRSGPSIQIKRRDRKYPHKSISSILETWPNYKFQEVYATGQSDLHIHWLSVEHSQDVHVLHRKENQHCTTSGAEIHPVLPHTQVSTSKISSLFGWYPHVLQPLRAPRSCRNPNLTYTVSDPVKESGWMGALTLSTHLMPVLQDWIQILKEEMSCSIRPFIETCRLITDASEFGLGAVLHVGEQYHAFQIE